MQGQQKDSGELEILWLVIGFLLLAGGIFFLFRQQILHAVLMVKYAELKLISFFIPHANYQGLANWANQADSNRISLHELSLLAEEVGQPLQIPSILLCIFFSVIIFFRHPGRFFRNKETMKTLADKMRTVFPAINIVHDLNLIKMPINEGPWAMALSPVDFLKKYNVGSRNTYTQKIVIDAYKAKLIFNRQLGNLWPGIDQLQAHEKAIFAILSAFINYKRDEAEAKMEEIASQLTPEDLKKNKITYHTDALLKKYRETPKVVHITKKHAYTSTVFCEMLTEARKSGIILNSLILWLKPIDRKLWYTLNNVGRKAVFIEAAGVHAHWLAERKLGFAIKQPMVDEAIFALDEAVQSRILKDL